MATTELFGLDKPQAWDTELAFQRLNQLGQAETKRTAERRLHELAIFPIELKATGVRDELGRTPTPSVLESEIAEARARRKLVLFAQLHGLPNGGACLHANDARGSRYWVPLPADKVDRQAIEAALSLLQTHIDKPLAIIAHGELSAWCRSADALNGVTFCMLGYPPVLDLSNQPLADSPRHEAAIHLARLEAESIHIIREAVAEAENPVMLYSIGKDSTVMLHLARKAFYPAKPPFPLLHIDTRWKFQEMYLFRDHMAQMSGMDLLVHINPVSIEKDINPFDHGSSLHTDITKTEGLKQALDQYRFDVAFGGARRDEEKSRAKERIFSFRTATHQWDAKRQRPEIWNLYNARKNPGESIRVFPLSNWTELDIWQYIYQENIPVVPLYFARERPVVERDGMIVMVDDARMRLQPGEEIQRRKVRFRTLGCYPLTGAVESQAQTVPEIILELLGANSSERQGRTIDADSAASMEKKKQAGYF
ncbi:sulfate adenylyltransferase small subunit [Sulfuriferula sp. AH1]|nr:sulfate adenylyltransferase small subunit [Sulfuriferula sp. AH1]